MNTLTGIEDFYNGSAAEYVQRTVACDMSDNLRQFVNHLPHGARVVDAGCGSGRDTAWFLANGFDCYSYDASQELCKLAQDYVGSKAQIHCHRHDALQLSAPADGIWASASLLFLNDEDLATALQALHANLKPGGVLYATFKHGTGWRQDGDRWFRDMAPEDGPLLEALSGLCVETVISDKDTLGRNNQWNAFLLRKPLEVPKGYYVYQTLVGTWRWSKGEFGTPSWTDGENLANEAAAVEDAFRDAALFA
jgi:SAM-dependent methyltransferase